MPGAGGWVAMVWNLQNLGLNTVAVMETDLGSAQAPQVKGHFLRTESESFTKAKIPTSCVACVVNRCGVGVVPVI